RGTGQVNGAQPLEPVLAILGREQRVQVVDGARRVLGVGNNVTTFAVVLQLRPTYGPTEQRPPTLDQWLGDHEPFVIAGSITVPQRLRQAPRRPGQRGSGTGLIAEEVVRELKALG